MQMFLPTWLLGLLFCLGTGHRTPPIEEVYRKVLYAANIHDTIQARITINIEVQVCPNSHPGHGTNCGDLK